MMIAFPQRSSACGAVHRRRDLCSWAFGSFKGAEVLAVNGLAVIRSPKPACPFGTLGMGPSHGAAPGSGVWEP